MKKTIPILSMFVLFIIHINIFGINANLATLNIYVENNNKMIIKLPIKIWFNDSLILTQEIDKELNVGFKIPYGLNLKISAQYGEFSQTKGTFSINILNDSTYDVKVEIWEIDYPVAIYGLKRIDDINYTPYAEENIFKPYFKSSNHFENRDSSINDYVNNCSVVHLFILNEKKIQIPIKLFLNDSLFMVKNFATHGSIDLKLYSKGVFRFKLQYGNYLGDNNVVEEHILVEGNKEYYLEGNVIQGFRGKTLTERITDFGKIKILESTEEINIVSKYIEKKKIEMPFHNKYTVINITSINENAPETDFLEKETILEEETISDIDMYLDNNEIFNILKSEFYNDLILERNGTPHFFRKLQKIEKNGEYLMLTYIDNNDRSRTTWAYLDSVKNIIINVYNNPMIGPSVTDFINIYYLILDKDFYELKLNDFLYSPYYNKYSMRMGAKYVLCSGIGFAGIFLIGELSIIPFFSLIGITRLTEPHTRSKLVNQQKKYLMNLKTEIQKNYKLN